MKRISTWLVLIAEAVAASQMHPGFATLFALSILLALLMLIRLSAHWEGSMMDGKNRRWRLAREFVIDASVCGGILFVLAMIVRHVPWFWFPVSS